jgi:hypothetical protein
LERIIMTARITLAMRADALTHIMAELRASGPCTTRQLRAALLMQCPGVDVGNVDAVFDWAWQYLRDHRVVQPYDDVPDAWEVHPRLPDPYGD